MYCMKLTHFRAITSGVKQKGNSKRRKIIATEERSTFTVFITVGNPRETLEIFTLLQTKV